MWGQMLPQSRAEQYPVLRYLCNSVTPGMHRDAQRDPAGQQEHGQLVSAAYAQNAQHQNTGGLWLGVRGWDSFCSCNCCYLCPFYYTVNLV